VTTKVTDTKFLSAEQARLYELVDEQPERALKEARQLRDDGPNGIWTHLRACVLTEAGRAARDSPAIEDGIAIFRKLLASKPDDPMVAYNLANALGALASLDQTKLPDRYLETAALRLESRALYGSSAKSLRRKDARIATQCLTNVGHALDYSFRWIEAFARSWPHGSLHLHPRKCLPLEHERKHASRAAA
jgi:hypothetical protein